MADPTLQPGRTEALQVLVVVARALPGPRHIALEAACPIFAQQAGEADLIEPLLGRHRQQDDIAGQVQPLDDRQCLGVLGLQSGQEGGGGHQIIIELGDRQILDPSRQVLGDEPLHRARMEEKDPFSGFEDVAAEPLGRGLTIVGCQWL